MIIIAPSTPRKGFISGFVKNTRTADVATIPMHEHALDSLRSHATLMDRSMAIRMEIHFLDGQTSYLTCKGMAQIYP